MGALSCKEETLYSPIHESLLEEILIRLPEKSIFKFKSVSKEWLSLISDPSFARSHISHRKALDSFSSPPWTILYYSTYGPYFKEHPPEKRLQFKSIASPDFTSPGVSVLPSRPDDAETVYIILSVCSISGLLLLYGMSKIKIHRLSNLHLCNPITAQWVTLPPAKCILQGFTWDLVTQVDNKGRITRYKVVIVSFTPDPIDVLNMHIFSSETNEWVSNQVCCSQPVQLKVNRAILLNGILHYLTKQHMILAYDPYSGSNTCDLIKCPTLKEFKKELCCVSQGRLLYFAQSSNHPTIRIWILKEYDRAEWHLEFKVKLPSDIDDSYSPFLVHPFNSSIVYLWHDHCISSFDLRTRRLEVCYDHINCIGMLHWENVFLYAFPPWPVSIPLPSENAIVPS